jgi:NAD(P)-dependent dehydrogenase (short-subunit alcohol dehydrogenase family)
MARWRTRRETPAMPGTVLVTGASRGMGRLIAAGLAARGWRVFATMRDPRTRDGLDAAVRAAGADPANVIVFQLDVRRPETIEAAVSGVLERTGGRLHACVANAGIFVAGAFEDTPAQAMHEVMETNYFGAIETVRAALPALRATHGRVVLISSDSGLCGTPGMSAYTASKYAIEGWGESVAYELEPFGVGLSIIEPGPFKTDIFRTSVVHRGPPTGPYAGLTRMLEGSLDAIGRSAPAPDPVVAAVLTALSTRRPRLRYPVGREARALSACKRFLPERLFGVVVKRATGMTAWRPYASGDSPGNEH